jgi:hypothetical protein
MRNEIPIFQAHREKNEWERRTNMRKLWVKAWMTLDGCTGYFAYLFQNQRGINHAANLIATCQS